MKYLIFILCLSLVGCGTLRHRSSKKDESKFQAAIQKVLSARNDIRLVISHTPTTEEEIDGPGREIRARLIFNVHEFAVRLKTIPLKGCPEDFRDAFVKYAEAWNDRAALDPKQEILLTGGRGPAPEKIPADAVPTERAWEVIRQVVNKYLNARPKED